MFKVIAFLVSLVSAGAFAPVARSNVRSSLKMSFDNELGILAPMGFWDPLGLSADGDQEVFDRRRAVELKHGRVAMLAVTGYLIQSVSRLPGNIDLDGTTFDSIPNGIAALGAVPSFGWLQIIFSIGFWELIGWEQRPNSTVGDFGWGSKAFGKELAGEKAIEYKTKEIQNGRLAMLGIMEILTHDIARPANEGLFVLHHL